jgi:PAS domain-containing protein
MSTLAAARSSLRNFPWSSETSLFERALDCLPDGVLVIREGVTIVYANRAFEKMWNVAEGVIASGNDSVLLSSAVSQVANAAACTAPRKAPRTSSRSRTAVSSLAEALPWSRKACSKPAFGSSPT